MFVKHNKSLLSPVVGCIMSLGTRADPLNLSFKCESSHQELIQEINEI